MSFPLGGKLVVLESGVHRTFLEENEMAELPKRKGVENKETNTQAVHLFCLSLLSLTCRSTAATTTTAVAAVAPQTASAGALRVAVHDASPPGCLQRVVDSYVGVEGRCQLSLLPVHLPQVAISVERVRVRVIP